MKLAALAAILLLAASAAHARGRAPVRSGRGHAAVRGGAGRPALRRGGTSFARPGSFAKNGSFGSARKVARRAADPAPAPYLYTPGALIRTEGQQPKYSDAAPAGKNTVEAGGFMNGNGARALGGAGVTWGAPDGRASAAASGSGVTANSAP